MRREYPEAPIVGVGVVALEGERVLLVQRGREPSRGLWTFPGGVVELGETLQEAARREMWEETGLEVEVGPVVEVLDRIVHDETGRVRYHYVLIDLLAHPTGGRLEVGDDAAAARWLRLEEMPTLDVPARVMEVAGRVLEECTSSG
jgi:8-oxo-dGTP diphosphatase